jgi:phosphopantothenoylcysteine decarboxylase/phosphopantothenate--cysteine ligase
LILFAVGPGMGTLQAPKIARALASAGHRVEVALGQGVQRFIGSAAFAASAVVVEEATELPDAVIVAPATAGNLARLARGIGGAPAEEACAAGVRPVVVALELDEATAHHPAVHENVSLLREDGYRVLQSSGGDMPSSEAIVGETLHSLSGPLSGLRIVVTAGGTREPLDKVRVISNRSSGKMGRAIVREAFRRGAEVAVVAADALIMAAAVSDFRPASSEEGKIRRGGLQELDLKLVATGDILESVRESNPELFMVGFAATYGDPTSDALEKLETKGIDLMVGNDISLEGSGFGSEENEVVIVGQAGERFVPRAPKEEVAGVILDALAKEIGQKNKQK